MATVSGNILKTVNSMRYKVLKRTGLKVSAVVSGSHISRTPQEQCNVAYNHALDKGVNLIFTSAAYKVAEEKIAKAVGNRRDEFYIVTTTDYRSAERAGKEIDQSLKYFNTDYIDIYNIGGVRKPETIDQVLGPGGAMEALLQAKKDGKIGHIGITGHRPEALEKAIKSGYIESVLFVFNWELQNPLNDMFPVCKQYNVDTFCMRPLDDGVLANYAERNLRFLFSSPLDVVVSGMYDPEIIDRNVELATIPPTKSEWDELQVQARELGWTGCRYCRVCHGWAETVCPYWIEIPTIMTRYYYRKKYGFDAHGETEWKKLVDKAKQCNSCGKCEEVCPYELPIIAFLRASIKETA